MEDISTISILIKLIVIILNKKIQDHYIDANTKWYCKMKMNKLLLILNRNINFILYMMVNKKLISL